MPAESPRNGSSETLHMVAVAQLVRVLDCDSRCRGLVCGRAGHMTGDGGCGRGRGTRESASGRGGESPRNGSSETRQMVAVAQLVRVLDCDSRCRGFESPQPPQFRSPMAGRRDDCTPTAMIAGGEKSLSRGARLRYYSRSGLLAQLVEQLTLNQ